MNNEKILKASLFEAQNGNKEAMTAILDMYKGFIHKTAVSFYINGYDLNDLIQICNLSLINAVRKYDLKKSSTTNFSSYACRCILNSLKYNLRNCTLKNNKEKFETSLYINVCEDTALIDCISSSQNIENEFISKEEAAALSKAIEFLSPDEKKLIKWFYFDRKNLKEYARCNNLTYPSVKQKKKLCLLKLKKIMTKVY